MTRIELFSEFIQKHPNWESEALITETNDCIYKNMPRDNYNNVINVETGEIFKGDERYSIYAKHIASLIGRPIHLCIKTLWHASIIGPVLYELKMLYTGEQTQDQFEENIKNSFIDIIRTPLYGIAMLATQIAGIILGIFCPNVLYYTRDYVGRMERYLLRVEELDQEYCSFSPYKSITPCFSPNSHFMRVRDVSRENFPIYSAINDFLENSDSFERNFLDFRLQPSDLQNINTNPIEFSIEEKREIIANLPLWFVGHFPEFVRKFLLMNNYSSLIVHDLDTKTDEEIEQLFMSQQESLFMDFVNPLSQTSTTLRALTLPKDDPKLAFIVNHILHQAWKNVLLESSEKRAYAASNSGIMTHDSNAILVDELRENVNQMTEINRNFWVNEAKSCALHEKLKMYGTQPWFTIAVSLPDS
ncbi:MAG: hypothetical protein H0T62_00935 [Parachlamydiaceae bacterium]|nr:hypothetical protein [Parachlamydiaceae bacterium]